MSTKPNQPDELNEILASPDIDFGVDEAMEQEVRASFGQMADQMGTCPMRSATRMVFA
jgi:hypothetical protein